MTALLEAAPWLLWLVPAAPLLLVAALPFDRAGRRLPLLSALAALPALLAALAGAAVEHEAGWVLLGARVAVDETGRVFLLLAAALWGLASLHAHGYVHEGRARFTLFWLLTMSGNLGLIVAADLVLFYCAFVVLTFAAYGLVVHERSDFALRAGRVYIVMAVLGEVALLAGLLSAAWASEGELGLVEVRAAVAVVPYRDAIIALLVAGFGVKAGLLGLHMWLPLAHPAAPVPASAVLSGVMIKAGLLGWLRFLPLDEASLEAWGGALVVAGLTGAFFAVVAGLPQRDPKITLAYSSVSQVGIMTAIVGLGLGAQQAASAALVAATFYALHHGLAKGALFLGVSVAASTTGRSRHLVLAVLALPALAIAGAPLSSGMVAKGLITGIADAHPGAATALALLPFTSIATTLLLARYLRLVAEAPSDAAHRSRWSSGAWLALTAAAVLAIWLLPAALLAGVEAHKLVYPRGLWDATWPLAAGLAVVAVALLWSRRRPLPLPAIPPGDLVVPLERAVVALGAAWAVATPWSLRWLRVWSRWLYRHTFALLFAGDRVERGLGNWTIAATLFVGIMVALIVLGGGW